MTMTTTMSTEIDPECPHGLGDPAWCSVCKHGPTKPEPVEVVSDPLRAKYAGNCPECDLPIFVGTWIVKLSNERYIHERCAP